MILIEQYEYEKKNRKGTYVIGKETTYVRIVLNTKFKIILLVVRCLVLEKTRRRAVNVAGCNLQRTSVGRAVG